MYAEKLPPHDPAAEEAVIGSLLVDGEAIAQVASFLKAEDFYGEKNRWCYEACLALWERREAINQVTLAHELARLRRLDELGGQAYLSHLVAGVPTSVHIEHYARIVQRTSTLRQLIRAASEIARLGYEGPADVEGALNHADDLLFRLRTGRPGRDFVHIREVLDRYLEESAAIAAGGPIERGVAPIPTGFTDLDQLLGGLQRADLIILAARPSLGKSALAINMARNAAGVGATVAIFSLEMSREQLALRLIASEAAVDGHHLRLGLYSEAEEKRIMDAVGLLSDLPIYIDDSPLASIVEIRAKARRLHLVRRTDLIILDYLQLVAGGNGRMENRVQEISEISRSLKGLARDLNVPVLAISQLSRAVEMRPSHLPQLSDLRESGSIEQDADVVAFIYREDLYFKDEEEWDRRFPDRKYPKNIAEIIVAKHRHGPVGNINLYFRDRLARFENLPSSGGNP
ncbi:MAG: replicative DNA helicase [Chloroflexi bacterium]|nr:replicative DNA helicase [Chloroflexota bacterium]